MVRALPGKEGLDSLGDGEIARGCRYEYVGKKYIPIGINCDSEIEHESILSSWMYCDNKLQETSHLDRSQAARQTHATLAYM